MKDEITYLFVYGSLRRGFLNDGNKYITHHFDFVGNCKARGRLYAGEYPMATSTDRESFVAGELYQIKEKGNFSVAIKHLDEYEGVDEKASELSLYKRKITDVFCKNTKVQAWIYWYNRKILSEILIPSGDIMNFIKINNNT